MSKSVQNSQMTSVQQVRHGLFRLHWIFDDAMLKQGCYQVNFFLGGSLLDQITITYHLNYNESKFRPYRYSVTVEAASGYEEPIDKEEGSDEVDVESIGSQPQLPQPQLLGLDKTMDPKLQELQEPVYMWINTDHSSTSGIKIPLLKKNANQWGCRRWCRKLRDRLTLWVDFGITSVVERNNLNVMKNIAEMFHSQTRCDVVFQFKDGQTIGAHVLILSAGSPVFARMFQDSTERKVEIDDFDIDVFTQLLTYLYTGVAPRLAEESITHDLLESANKYGVETLKGECANVLMKRITIENDLQILTWSLKHSASTLFEAAMQFLVDNFCEICYRPEWMDLIKNDPELCMLVTRRIADHRSSVSSLSN